MSHTNYRVVVGERGRVVIPAAVRAELGLEPGTKMVLDTQADGSLRLRSYRVIAEQGLGMLAHLAPPGESLVDDLLRERRAAAAREDEEERR